MTDKEQKKSFVVRLQTMCDQLGPVMHKLEEIDSRIPHYISDVALHSDETVEDLHNIDEVAACCRFMRMANTYNLDVQHVKEFIRMYEKFKFSGMKGRTCYSMTPIQAYMTAGIFAFIKDDGRRVVREAIIFIPRKFAKTTYLAALAADDILSPIQNSECHIVANAEAQAKIAFKEARALLMQLDPNGSMLRFTANEINFKHGAKAEVGGRVIPFGGLIQAHTAGGKTKDGAFASLVLADEYGSAQYVKDHCDMSDALNVYESSMGPRPNPLTVIATTAGRVIDGPFEQKMRVAQNALYKELDYEYTQTAETDWQFLLALHPDAWEYTDEYYAQPRMHRKVNPHIGITIQEDYYEQQWNKAQGDPEVYKETVTKLFNQFINNSSKPWIQAEDIRRLQTEYRIDQLDSKEWRCFVGCDFSHGDDLHTLGYHCVNIRTRQYFWDCDVWIAEEQLSSNPNAVLYQHFIEAGDMHTSSTKVIPSSLLVERLEEINRHAPIVRLGYDAYDATDNLNDIRTWFVMKLKAQGKSPHQIEELLKAMIVPVSQTWASYSAPTNIAWKMVNEQPQKLWVSRNEVLPWCFSNAILDVDRLDNVKPIKRHANAKVDPVQAIISGIKMEMELKP